MIDIKKAIETGIHHHRQGNLQLAQQQYQLVLQQTPDQPDALHLLGVVALQTGNLEPAVDLFKKSIRKFKRNPDCHANLGIALLQQNRLEAAQKSMRRALKIDPNHVDALYNLGLVLTELKKPAPASSFFRKVISIAPNHLDAHINLGIGLMVQHDPAGAEKHFQKALEISPGDPRTHNNLGNLKKELGDPEQALICFQEALRLNPDDPQIHYNIAVVLADQGKLDEAISSFRLALSLAPDAADIQNNLGNALLMNKEYNEAIKVYKTLVANAPDFPEGHLGLATCLCYIGNIEEGVSHYRQASKAGIELAHVGSISNLSYLTGTTPQELLDRHREWDQNYANTTKRAKYSPPGNERSPERKIRLGYVSADLRRHPVGYFLLPVVKNHNQAEFEVFCYSNSESEDDLSSEFQDQCDQWRPISGIEDDEVYERIVDDQIDILVDLSGFTGGNRRFVLARKPAPIQTAWIGYTSTTGMTAIDYFLSDRWGSPPENDPFFSETIVRLPDGWLCYEPPGYAPPVAPLPALTQGYITFGSFNDVKKLRPETIKLWAEVLNQVPQSRLIVKTGLLGYPDVHNYVKEMFDAVGLDQSRVELRGPSPHQDLLACYNEIDIALDTAPYSGGLTTLEALWMGVPVVTLAGQTFASRHGVSHLSNVGLEDWITDTEDAFVKCAVDRAGKIDALAELRLQLREQMAQSPVCDASRFTKNLEAAYRKMWITYCGA